MLQCFERFLSTSQLRTFIHEDRYGMEIRRPRISGKFKVPKIYVEWKNIETMKNVVFIMVLEMDEVNLYLEVS